MDQQRLKQQDLDLGLTKLEEEAKLQQYLDELYIAQREEFKRRSKGTVYDR